MVVVTVELLCNYKWRVQGKNRRCHICKIVDLAGSSKVRSGHLRFFHGIAFHQRRPQVDWASFSHGTYHGWKLWDVSKRHMRLTPELKFFDISGSSLGPFKWYYVYNWFEKIIIPVLLDSLCFKSPICQVTDLSTL